MPSSLDRLFASASQPSSKPPPSSSTTGPNTDDDPVVKELANGYKKLASGIVLDPSGKPCRQCSSVSSWMAMTKKRSTPASSSSSSSSSTTTTGPAAKADPATTTEPPVNGPASGASAATIVASAVDDSSTEQQCPPDVDQLGRATWTLLHTLTATYPSSPSPSMQATTKSFIQTFAQLYPCGYCAEDFRDWMREQGNEVNVKSQDEFGEWACRAHNAVNVKLGKREFDCGLWKERWRDGWGDGRCG
ncbi:Mitochondrial FAD-linked sulfhydryl oxidase ERV1 [Cyphellophora attinorum]|uniref:Sulfhydryl oxidase n=1 Tax=Cyphellophora attinorum TaxID=1664694 RepID=A0A0N1HQU5_9EURO|nr:Mitochondrial FAD-linked sulfhydryl oxidase ERV1 [Phialophora attinorum]KPI40443.1 Mitochondrial FAD-linked sulfhydryl oxidase ERV1 [Phialophora attinorum]